MQPIDCQMINTRYFFIYVFDRAVGMFCVEKQQNSLKFFNEFLVPRTRLELAQRFRHYHLKVACIPISPPGLNRKRRLNHL